MTEVTEITEVIEEWKKIIMDDVEYEYEISDMGRVRNSKTNQILKLFGGTDGYLRCKLYEEDDKTFKIHRLGATMFLPNPNNLKYVNHLNHDQTDNRIVNLEWSTHSDNIKHAHTKEGRVSTGKPIILYEEDCVTPICMYDSIRIAATELNIPEKNIGPVLSGRIKYTGNKYHFKYANPKQIITEDDLKDFEEIKEFPNYLIHRDSRVYNKSRKIMMQPREVGGYVYLIFGTKNSGIHQLVAKQFLPNPDNKECVNHKDGNKLNNHVDNLEWSTKSENTQHAYDTGLNPNVVSVKQYKLDGTFVADHKSIADACRALELDPKCGSTIGNCCKYNIKHAYNFIWRYATDTTPVEGISISSRNGKKMISQYTKEGVHVKDFKSLADAAQEMTNNKRNGKSISQCCKGIVESAHGYVFKFKET